MFVKMLISCLLMASSLAIDEMSSKQMPIKNLKYVTPNFIQQGTFRTRLDHFRPQDGRTFEMDYEYNDIYARFNGPIFVYVKDTEEYTSQWIEEGLMVDVAVDTGALLVTMDRRYFGNSIPDYLNATFEDLQYLSVEQQLSDYAFLIQHVKENHPGVYYSKVIVWGSGYGGTLSAWLRKKYPHFIDGAWSSSGIYQFRAYSDSFYDLLSTTLRIYGTAECADDVAFAFNVMEYMIEAGEGEYLQETLNLCHPVDTTNENAAAMLIERQIAFISDYINEYHFLGLQDFCRDMNRLPNDGFSSFAQWVDFVYGANVDCHNHDFDTLIESYATEEWDTPGVGTYTGRQLFYEQCTQLGFRGTTSTYSVFPELVTTDYHFYTCQQIFGENYVYYLLYEALYDLAIQYSTLTPATTQVIYTNGMLDPYLYQGIVGTPQPASYILNIQYHARSADLTSIAGWDPVVLTAAKERIAEILKIWLYPF